MLHELTSVQQVAGERKRRWFFCQALDLVVWVDDSAHPVGFQLAYDKVSEEHSFSWHAEKGYAHYIVDSGGRVDEVSAMTPFLYRTATTFPAERVAKEFERLSGDMPAGIADFVLEKINAYAPA